MKINIPSLTIIMACFFPIKEAAATSFDCKSAKTSVEQAICLDENLSLNDEKMSRLYKEKVRNTRDAQLIIQNQRDWLRLVRNRCSSIQCLQEAYNLRIESLKNGYPIDFTARNMVEGASVRPDFGEVRVQSPASADYQNIANWLRRTNVLEESVKTVAKLVNKSHIPSITARQCGNQYGGAYYLSTKHEVHICYEYLSILFGIHANQVKIGESTDNQEAWRAFASIKFISLHEIAHALLHRDRNMGSIGPEEAEADNIASTLLLSETQNDDQIKELTWAIQRLTASFGVKTEYTWNEYSDEHLLPQQRLASFLCLAVGKSPNLKPWAGQLLSTQQAQRCSNNWSRTFAGVNALLTKLK